MRHKRPNGTRIVIDINENIVDNSIGITVKRVKKYVVTLDSEDNTSSLLRREYTTRNKTALSSVTVAY